MINYRVKLVNNYNQIEFEINEEAYERFLDELTDDADFITYDKFVEREMKFANLVLANTTATATALAAKSTPVPTVKRVITEEPRPSDKQLLWARNLGVENPEQYSRKELGEIIKNLLGEQ